MMISGVILAGGQSTRMGRNKAVLEIGGKRLIDRLAHGLQGIFPEVIIVANTPGLYDDVGVRVGPDLIPDKGALGGDAVVPSTGDWEPLFALYAKTCLPEMERLIRAGDLKIARFFPSVRVRRGGPAGARAPAGGGADHGTPHPLQ